jgi:hypothetical protein
MKLALTLNMRAQPTDQPTRVLDHEWGTSHEHVNEVVLASTLMSRFRRENVVLDHRRHDTETRGSSGTATDAPPQGLKQQTNTPLSMSAGFLGCTCRPRPQIHAYALKVQRRQDRLIKQVLRMQIGG